MHFAPISRNARAILRQKTLLDGEVYVELAPPPGEPPSAAVEREQPRPEDALDALDPEARREYREYLNQRGEPGG